MVRPSIIDRLPAEIRELIAQRRREGTTIRGIQLELAELGVKVSQTSLGRYTKRLDTIEHANRRAGLAPVMVELRLMRVALQAIHARLTAPKPTL